MFVFSLEQVEPTQQTNKKLGLECLNIQYTTINNEQSLRLKNFVQE